MDNRTKFNSTLSTLVDYATANGNKITKKDITDCFKDIISDDKMYEPIYAYLTSKKIVVEDYTDHDGKAEEFIPALEPDLSGIKISEEAAMFLDMYKKDLEAIPPLAADEKNVLIAELILGKESAAERLIEAHLQTVLGIAYEYTDREVPVNDLIQEGNIGLINAILSYDASIDFDEYIYMHIKQEIEAALDEQISSDRIGTHLAESANRLDAVSKALSEEFGREPSVSELAEHMCISEDEVERILKFSLNALTVDGADSEAPSDSHHDYGHHHHNHDGCC